MLFSQDVFEIFHILVGNTSSHAFVRNAFELAYAIWALHLQILLSNVISRLQECILRKSVHESGVAGSINMRLRQSRLQSHARVMCLLVG